MMMDPSDSDRSQILADFQACSNIDDIGHALAVLDATNWNLTEAVNMALGTGDSEDTQEMPGMRINGRGLDVTGRFSIAPAPPAIDLSNDSGPITVRRETPPLRSYFEEDQEREQVDHLGISRRRIIFHVQHQDDLFKLELLDSEGVEELRGRIAVHIDVDESEFDIQWEDRKMHPEDNLTLRELNLPRINTLRVVPRSECNSAVPSTSGASATNGSISENLSKNFKLKVEVNPRPGHRFTTEITEPGMKTVLEIKEWVHKSYEIPVIHQNWAGWPSHVTDDMTLAACQLNTPTHLLVVDRLSDTSQQASTSGTSSQGSRSVPIAISDSDSEHDYDMIGDDNDLDMEVAPQTRQLRLIAPHIEDISEASSHFNREFVNRYGSVHAPLFFTGTFKEAVDSALQRPASERRLLAVYLHHDESVAANVFCSQVLCSETVSTYLNTNFVIWGWDVTLPMFMERFATMFESVLGPSSADVVRRLQPDHLPVLVILSKVRASIEVLSMSRATVSAEEMMISLLQAEEVFQQSRSQDIREEEERKNREETKRLQDAAYEESLALDRVKQQQLRQQQEEAVRKEREEEEARRLEQQTMEAIKQSAAETIPDEPPSDCKDNMARLRFRCPNGELLNRRFLGSTSLATLLNYLVTKGFRTEEYKVLTTFPRRDLSVEDTAKTLEDLELCPQETLILAAK